MKTEIFDFLLEKLVREQKLRMQNERIYLAALGPRLADADLKSRFAICLDLRSGWPRCSLIL